MNKHMIMKINLNITRLVILSGLLWTVSVLAQTQLLEAEPVDSVLLEGLDMPPLPEESATSIPNDQTTQSVSALPEELSIDFFEPPPDLDEEIEKAEPEPVFEDLLTPEIQTPVELKALNASIKARKAELKLMDNKIDRINVKQELIATRQEKIALREEQINARQDKLNLKREEIEAQLADPDLKPQKRKRLEAKLERILQQEALIDDKLAKLQARSQKLEEKLERLQQRLVDLGEESPEEIDI